MAVVHHRSFGFPVLFRELWRGVVFLLLFLGGFSLLGLSTVSSPFFPLRFRLRPFFPQGPQLFGLVIVLFCSDLFLFLSLLAARFGLSYLFFTLVEFFFSKR